MNTKHQEQIDLETSYFKSVEQDAFTQIARLEKATDRTLAKLSSVITLSGLLTFLSFAFTPQANQTPLVQFYLIWVLPYLLISIVLWVYMFKKSASIVRKELTMMESDHPFVMHQYFNMRQQLAIRVHKGTHEIFEDTRKLFAMSLSFIIGYLFLYVLSFYFFAFFNLPTTLIMILITIITLLLMKFFYDWYAKTKIIAQANISIQIPMQTPDSGANSQAQTPLTQEN